MTLEPKASKTGLPLSDSGNQGHDPVRADATIGVWLFRRFAGVPRSSTGPAYMEPSPLVSMSKKSGYDDGVDNEAGTTSKALGPTAT